MKNKYLLSTAVALLLLNYNSKSQCLDQTVGPVSNSIVCAGSGTISLASSEAGVNYYVRNDASNAVVSGPVSGSGGTVLLGTGHMTASSIFNIYAKKATGGLQFDGVDDDVDLSGSLDSYNSFSWEAWIKTGTDGTIFSKTAATGNWASGGKSLYIANGKLTFAVNGIGSTETYNTYNDNNWHHVAVTCETNYLGTLVDRVRLYVDGVFLTEKNNWDIQANGEAGLVNHIGFTNTDFPTTPYFTGVMDDIKIWGAARTGTDVTADMTSCLTGTETNLDAYFTFENGTGTTLTDNAGGDNTGTLNNMSNASWVYGRDDCGSCTFQLSQKPVFVVTAISDQSLTAQSQTLCSTVATTITASGSDLGVNYYLRDNSTYSIITGPFAGTGGTLGISTGIVANTTTYNVLANRLSGGLVFDGIDDYVGVNENAVLDNLGLSPFTLEAWIYPTSSTALKSIISKEGDYNLYLNNGNLVTEVFPGGSGGGSFLQATTTSSITLNKWSHIAAIWDGTNVAVYVNGITSTLTTGNLTSTVTSKFCIGGSKPLGQNYAGRVDELRIWNTMRTVAQLTANVGSCLTGTETGLMAYYQFEDGKGSATLMDKTINGNNGVLSNMDDVQAWKGGVENCGCSYVLTPRPSISANTSPTVSVNSGSICSGNSFTVSASGADTYTITGGTFTVAPGTTTSYSVTGSNSLGCVSFPAVSTITVSTSPTIIPGTYSVCTGNTIAILPTGADSYSITGGNFTVNPSTTTTYSITGTNTTGCVATNTAVATVSVNTTPTISVNSGSVCSGTIFSITPSGADVYTVTGGNFTVTPTTTTSYSVTGASTLGCMALNMVVANVTVNTTPTISVNNATICEGNSVTIVPSGADTYSINGNTFTVSPAASTSYSITGSSTLGCMASNTAIANISISATPTIGINSGSICAGESFTLIPSGANSYTVSGSNLIVNPSTTTSYSVTGTSIDGCLSSTAVVTTITVSASPSLTVSGNSALCTGESTTLTANGATTYSWNNTASSNTIALTPTANTTYTIMGASGSCSSIAFVNISVNVMPTVAVNSGSVCLGSTFTIVPTGATSYTISGGSATVSPLSNTTYSVSGSTGGCVSNAVVVSSVSVLALPIITASTSNTVICFGESVILAASGGTNYSWSDAQSGGSITVSPPVNTIYTVTGVASTGCANTATVFQKVDNCTAIAQISANTLIFGVYPNPNSGQFVVESGENVTLTVLNSLGQSVYTEQTSSPKTTVSITSLANGIYFIKAKSASNQQVVRIVKE